ncbi:protodermal factor 1-like isoform X1 [Rhododendron vialii]|uniref:protodermal factor 1-like isoform X1 n=1 Tax=Rhododendron vialii TaxID=182163 RepID=UPI00265FDB6E|nr:protodermal factor 1-like isoform X1 [Rhododendron vialii]
MSERGKLLLQPGFLATHVKIDYEGKKNEWIKRNNEIRKSHGVKSNATPFRDDDDNESVSFEQEAIEMAPGHRNVRGHRDTPSPPQSVTPSPTQGLTSSPHTPFPSQNVTPSPTQVLTSSPPQGLAPSPHTPSPHQRVTPSPPQGLTSSPTQGFTPSKPSIVAQSTQVSGTGPSSSKRVRGPTVSKSLDKFIAHHEGKKLVVTVPEEMKAFCGVNATMAATDLGVQIRRFCPIQGFAHSWKSVDPMAKKAILQSNRDKFDIVDGTEGREIHWLML